MLRRWSVPGAEQWELAREAIQGFGDWSLKGAELAARVFSCPRAGGGRELGAFQSGERRTAH